ncbi:STAS domain-containing protein [Streptomyces sp. NPDC058612]|uniref:STAS domain-containing protein n=1 Tax=Streptomyces sp. NPDC058612 TaxID=3346555 RepID=UPI0036600479
MRRLDTAVPRKPGGIRPPRRATRTVVVAGRYGLLHLTGELDVESAPAVRDAVRRSLHGHPARLRIDISGVSFCDCSGLRALLWAKAEAARAGTGFHLSGPLHPAVARVLDATGTAVHLGLAPQPAGRRNGRGEERGRAPDSDTARQPQTGATSRVVAR